MTSGSTLRNQGKMIIWTPKHKEGNNKDLRNQQSEKPNSNRENKLKTGSLNKSIWLIIF